MPAKRILDPQAQQLREALAPYLDTKQLRNLAAGGGNLRAALQQLPSSELPAELLVLLDVLSALLRTGHRESIGSPADIAGLLMVEMGRLEQEELRVVILSTKNHVVDVVTVYRGTINSSAVRVAEVFKEAIRRNAASIIVAHNHPSGEPTPSPEDVQVTRQIVEAGNLLDVDVLDHLVIGQGRWTSLRERGLGFDGGNAAKR